MKKYYLVLEQEGELFILDGPVDITKIDLLTINYTKQEFFDYYFEGEILNEDDVDIYIVNPTTNPRNKAFYYTYDCLFSLDNMSKAEEELYTYFKKIANNRLIKSQQKENTDIDNYVWEQFISTLITQITNNSDFKYDVLKFKTVDYYLREQLYSHNSNKIELPIKNKLKNYLKLRGLFLSFIQAKHMNYSMINESRYCPRDIFEIAKGDYKQFQEIKNLNQKREELVQQKIHNLGIDNPELEYYFEHEGTEGILENMDTNEIYNSSIEDLIKTGIINDKEYRNKR